MTIEHGKVNGDLLLSQTLVLHGMATGNITVVKGGVFTLHGVCTNNLVIEKDGEAYLHGTVIGNVLNHGGRLEIYGTVNGYLHTTNDGETFVDKDAVVSKGISDNKGE